MTRDFMPSSLPSKCSPGYRPGEQEAIARFLAEREKTICPGFGSGEQIPPSADGPQGRKNEKLAASGRTGRRINLEQERKARELRARIEKEFAKDSAPRCYERIAAIVGTSPGTVGAHLRKAGLVTPRKVNWG